MISGNFCTDLDQILRAHPELGDVALRLHLGDHEILPLRLRDARWFARTRTELKRGIPMLLNRPVRQHLKVFKLQNSHRDVFARIRKDASHTNFLSDDTGTHLGAFLP